MNTFDKLSASNYGNVVVRVGISLVFIWFGTNQLMHPESWVSLVPNYILKLIPFSAHTLVLGNGLFEVIAGLLLLAGVYTRIVSLLLALHIAHIATTLGYNAIAVRDFGLTMATISIFLNGPDMWTLDTKLNPGLTSKTTPI